MLMPVTDSIKIDDCIITYNHEEKSIRIRSVKLEKRINKQFNESNIRVIDSGSKLHNAYIIGALLDHVVDFDQLMEKDISQLINFIVDDVNKKFDSEDEYDE